MKLSIIVVTWNNENFIEESLKSCLIETRFDYEVIVVHNASTDSTGELIRRASEGNENRFKVIENERNEGLGRARNIGIQHSTGEYIVFLDGDDWYEPGALQNLLEKLNEKNPDVLVFNYQRAWDTGGKEKNIMTHLLAERDISSPEARRNIMVNISSSSNKAYRRKFINEIQARFPDGFYEDIVWSFKTLYMADSCYVIPNVVFNYRQRSGSITRSIDDRHLDIIKQYRTLLQLYLDQPEALKLYGDVTYKYGRGQILNVLNKGTRLPKNKQKEFLKLTSGLLNDWRAMLDIKTSDKALLLVNTNSPILYNGARLLHSYKERATKAFKRSKSVNYTKRVITKVLYRYVFCKLSLKHNSVYFEAYWGAKADCNPLAIATELNKAGRYNLIWGFSRKGIIPQDFPYKTVRKGTLAYYYAVATSGYMVSNANFDGDVIKRVGSKHLQTHHGTPLKSMGLDIRPYNPKETNWRNYARRCMRWDYVISSNTHSSSVWRKAMPYNYKVIETGYPRNDMFFNSTKQEIDELKESLGISTDKKLALYAPTWREKSGSFKAEISPREIKSALGDDYILLLRSHYFNDGATTTQGNGIINVSDYPFTNNICSIADMLITDYSSIMFDFGCLKRPIVLFAYDYEDYVRERGVYFNLTEHAPGAVAYNSNELIDILMTKSFENNENQMKLMHFNNKFCPWDDGLATIRVINKVFQS